MSVEQAAVTTEAKRLRRRIRDSQAAAERHWVLNEHLRIRALLVYTLAECSVEPAVVYVSSEAARRGWPVRTEAEIARMVEDLFLAADDDEIESFHDQATPSDPDAMRAALAWVEQWRLRPWAESNNRLGIHPDTRLAIETYEARRAALPADLRPRLWLGTPGARKRGTRWRERWGGRDGSLRPRDVAPLPQLRERVCASAGKWVVMSRVSQFPNFGLHRHQVGHDFLPRFRARFWDRFLALALVNNNDVTICHNIWQKRGALFVPRFWA